MLKLIEALHFRSLRYVRQEVQGFHTLVGPNGSGKSSFLDCVAFLGDLLREGPARAIQGNGLAGRRAVDPAHLVWMRTGTEFQIAIELELSTAGKQHPGLKRARYEVAVDVVGPSGINIRGENLWILPARADPQSPTQPLLFPDPPVPPASIIVEEGRHAPPGWVAVVRKTGSSDYFHAETSSWRSPFKLGPTKSALANLPEDEDKFPTAIAVKRLLLEGVQRVELDAHAMRRPSAPGAPRRFLPDGSNLPWVVEELSSADPVRFEAWVSHLRTALPDLKSLRTVERPEDRHRYLVLHYETGLEAPSWVVSDGTLRMLALTLPAYLPADHGIYLIEEPENGIHPQAVETVFQSLSSVYDAQVFCASHSPIVLGLASPEQVLCFAKDASGATDIVRGDLHPRLRDWRGSLEMGSLFAAGVLG